MSSPLGVRDVILPFVGVLGGYVLGILQSVAADHRERRSARNRLLYVLFRMYRGIRTSRPDEVLPLMMNFLRKRLGATEMDGNASESLKNLLSPILQKVTSGDLSALGKSFGDGVNALIPIDTILALRLAGDRSARFDTLVREYYQSVGNRLDAASDPNVPQVLSAMEGHALEVAFKTALAELESDIRELANSFWIRKRRQLLKELAKCSAPISEVEFAKHFGPELDEILKRINAVMAPGNAAQ